MKTSILLARIGLYGTLMLSCTLARAQNLFLGTGAGASNTSGYSNTFVGGYAGNRNTTGYSNTFTGAFAGYLNTTGPRNVATGTFAGYLNTTGSDNTFVGYFAGFRSVGTSIGLSHNTFVGSYAGQYNTEGFYNTFLGTWAGEDNTTGAYNTLVGTGAGANTTTGLSNTFVGYSAGGNTTTANANAFVGNLAGFNNTTGANNAYLGSGAGGANQTGSGNTFLGVLTGSSTSLANSAAIGYRARVTASNCLVLGSINGVNGATANTNVGIGLTAPAYRLQLGSNSAAKPGSNVWTVASDRRLKEDIRPFEDGLRIIQQIHPVRYRYNGKAGLSTEEEYIGIIAQEVQEIAPYMVGAFTHQDSSGTPETYLDFDGGAMVYLLINAVKELKAEVESLRSELGLSTETATQTKARLWQNYPNPADGSTVIRYLIPNEAHQANLRLISITGQEVQNLKIPHRGEGAVTFRTGQFPAGTYVYQLVIDGETIDTKKLVLVR
ncbi:tail fiber domain-containing protein [Catalinimonas alkaloidigena]|nr:tail fiber domain-containing protein [Catalinimonas alkaloidigena]